MQDPNFLSDVKHAGRAVSDMSGEEMSDIVESAPTFPDDIERLFVKAITGGL